MKWSRIPSPGKMTGGNRWIARSGSTEYVITKANGHYYLTAAVGFAAQPLGIGVFNSFSQAKKAPKENNPMAKRRRTKSHTSHRAKAKRITAQIRKLKAQRKKLYR